MTYTFRLILVSEFHGIEVTRSTEFIIRTLIIDDAVVGTGSHTRPRLEDGRSRAVGTEIFRVPFHEYVPYTYACCGCFGGSQGEIVSKIDASFELGWR